MSFPAFSRAVGWLPLLFAVAGTGRADIKLPAIFGDHMVLQQEVSAPIWGTANPGEEVTVEAAAQRVTVVAGKDGAWRVDLKPFPNSSVPMEVTVRGKNTITFTDVLVGDVWLCSGQSNMEFALSGAHDAKTELPQAADSDLRLFCVTHKRSLQPLSTLEGHWQQCTPDAAKDFSAVAYFFGRELRSHLHRPVGLIDSCWGGSTAQAWTSLAGLQKAPAIQRYLDLYQKNLTAFPALNEHYEVRLAAYQEALKQWTAENGGAERAWLDQLRKARAAHEPDPPKTFPAKPVEPPTPGGDHKAPANLFNGMIAPLLPYALKGVIWYQGEYNTDDPMEYYVLFPRLIADWREKWGAGNLPFLFVQLPALWPKEGARSVQFDNWDIVRDAQARTLSLPNTGMAVAMDVGGGLHPPGKIFVGKRLALLARKRVYGEASLSDSGPVYASARVEGNQMRIFFQPSAGGIAIGVSPMPDTAEVQPKDSLGGFEVAGADQVWNEAQARIDGDTVLVSSPKVPAPVAARYGGGNGRYDAECNLYSKGGLPAQPFRTDDWQDFVPAIARTQGRVFPETLFPAKPAATPQHNP